MIPMAVIRDHMRQISAEHEVVLVITFMLAL